MTPTSLVPTPWAVVPEWQAELLPGEGRHLDADRIERQHLPGRQEPWAGVAEALAASAVPHDAVRAQAGLGD